jgi:hypothetical protein
MRKPVAIRFAGLLVLYFGVFSFLVVLQFNGQEGISLQTEVSTASGRYEEVSPGDYALAAAWAQDQYADRVSRWRDQIFTAWNRTPTSSLDNEELITAYIAESVRRGSYREVLSRVPRSFLGSPRQTYFSSPFLGNLIQVSYSLSAEEEWRISRFEELAAGSPAEFLADPHAFAESAVRGNDALIDRGIAVLSSLESPVLDMIPPILEACVDLAAYRKDNSLMFLIEPSLSLIAKALWKDPANDRVFVFAERDGELTADTEFNLRLGIALDQYGRLAGREDWAAVGRSLILSVLAQTDTVGMVSATFSLNANGVLAAVQESRISAARLYRYLRFDNYPRAERIAGNIDGWMWTAASSVEVTQDADITDIAVAFPAGETHYIIFRDIKPFAKIQLHGIDYRTDPRFERYDSSGWNYASSEQILFLKMKQRDPVEHIVIHNIVPPAEKPVPESE